MAHVVVAGGGVGGLGAALVLGRHGHRVTIVERDAPELPSSPDDAFSTWTRRGAPQVRHSHAFLARLRNLLRDTEPALLADLLAAGATELRFADQPPAEMEDRAARAGDDDLVALACRRTTFEWVLRRAAGARGAELVHGVVQALTATPGPGAVPAVRGVVLEGGERIDADLVVDATGRRSALPSWLEAVGARSVEERSEDTGIVYASRFYRLLPGVDAPVQDGPIGGDLGYLKFAVFAGDNRTFSITFGIPTGDADLRALFHEGPFTAAARTLPAAQPWLAEGVAEPITGVEVMARLLNRIRRFVDDDGPVVTGLYAVGDSNVCTNPLYGRGCSLAMVHADALGTVIAAHGADPVAAAVAFDAATRQLLEPWYRAALAQDRQARRDAGAATDTDNDNAIDSAAGRTDDGDAPVVAPAGLDADSLRSLMRDGLMPAVRTDPVVFRAFLRVFNLLNPPEAMLADPEVIARVLTAWQARDERPPAAPLGPDRAVLLRALHDAAGNATAAGTPAAVT